MSRGKRQESIGVAADIVAQLQTPLELPCHPLGQTNLSLAIGAGALGAAPASDKQRDAQPRAQQGNEDGDGDDERPRVFEHASILPPIIAYSVRHSASRGAKMPMIRILPPISRDLTSEASAWPVVVGRS